MIFPIRNFFFTTVVSYVFHLFSLWFFEIQFKFCLIPGRLVLINWKFVQHDTLPSLNTQSTKLNFHLPVPNLLLLWRSSPSSNQPYSPQESQFFLYLTALQFQKSFIFFQKSGVPLHYRQAKYSLYRTSSFNECLHSHPHLWIMNENKYIL